MKERIEQQKRIFKYILLVFAMVIIIADACLIIMHEKTFSETENRMLQQFPKFKKETLLSGKFMTQSEDFVADQFFLRDYWIGIKLKADKVIGRQTSNGVILGKDGYLIEDSVAPAPASFEKNLNAIQTFAEKHDDLKIVMTVVPNAVSICDQLLPENMPVHSQKEDLAAIKKAVSKSLTYVDLTSTLSAHKDEYIYYRSDHHWTSLGAKYAFEAMKESLGTSELTGDLGTDTPEAFLNVYNVTESFSGTMASSSGDFSVMDSIDIYVYEIEDFQYVVEYTDAQKKSATVFNSAALSQKNKYEVFLGGNHPQINIKTTNLNKRNLLILKDSYANAFIPFLLPYYQTITIVDPRYYSDDLEKLIADTGITDILFLYNMNTFATDNSLAGVLQDE